MTTAKVTHFEKRISKLEKQVTLLMDHLEYAEASAGIQRGLREMEKGLGTPLSQVDKRLRAKYNIPRSTKKPLK
jgi:hypothetical protein